MSPTQKSAPPAAAQKFRVVAKSDTEDSSKHGAVVDLRSDTVTKPSPEMRRAMAEAEVGDDVYGEDPTVNRLEQRAAEIFGREAAIFVPTGTMGNQVAIKLHTQPAQEIICESRAHVFNWEMATLASFSGCMVRPVHSDSGVLTWSQIEPYVAAKTYYRAQTGLIVLENTHNMAGGSVSPTETIDEVCRHAKAAGIPVHMDGARVFNAATALKKDVAQITKNVDSVMFCLSKGLGAPIGSLLVGSAEFIERARSVRKALGGGMRQVGIIAAAGLIALEKMPARLGEDHANAKFLAEGLANVPGIKIDAASVQTNIVIFEIKGGDIPRPNFSAADLVRQLGERNVLAGSIGPRHVRFVTHMDVDRAACARALEAMQQAMS